MRTREFLWQEGHTAYANKEDAVKEVSIFNCYCSIAIGTAILFIIVMKIKLTAGLYIVMVTVGIHHPRVVR